MPSSKPLVIDNEEALRQIFPRSPILSSGKAGWDGIYLEYHCQPPHEIPEICSPWHGILMFPEATAPIQSERTIDGRFQHDCAMAGDILLTPANVGHSTYCHAEHSFLMLGLEPVVFARTLDESAALAQVELVPRFATSDPLIYQIGLALKGVLESNGVGSRLYAETMATALVVHLLQYYSARKTIPRDAAGGLPQRKLQQVIDYINDHLDQDLGLAELAAVMQMSHHYFSHLFKQSTGQTPHQYVIRCRVERAKQLLLKGELTLAEIAYKVGFANQSHLNRHFKRLVGATPKAFVQR